MEYVDVQSVHVPALGFGTWRLDGHQARDGVRHALEVGYRHIDTAAMYGNEDEVGAGIRDAGVARDEIFLVTKIPPGSLDAASVHRTVQSSVDALGPVDLLLIHWPSSRGVPLGETLGAMREAQEQGHATHLGVSNFPVDLLREAMEHATIVADQVEFNPFKPQDALVAFAAEHDLLVTAYSPLAKGRVTRDATLQEIADAHDATPAQVALRWLLDQPNTAVIPKAASDRHRESNLAALDLALTDDERQRIAGIAR